MVLKFSRTLFEGSMTNLSLEPSKKVLENLRTPWRTLKGSKETKKDSVRCLENPFWFYLRTIKGYK